MKKERWTVRTVAEWVGGRVEGDEALELEGLAPVDQATATQLTFAADAKWAGRLTDSRAGAAIVDDKAPPASMTLIRVGNVLEALTKLLERMAGPPASPPRGRHPTAVVADSAQVAADAAIGPHVVIEAGARIGARCVLCAGAYVGAGVELGEDVRLEPGVVVREGCRIGNRAIIGPNSVIGYDGFGYFFAGGVHHKVPHVGAVVIEDDVELGACTCVDRAKFGQTVIGAGTKIDNLVQVAHNVQIGKGCLLAALVGVAGSARLGDFVALGGHAGIRDNISIGAGVQASAFAAVASDVPDGQVVGGIPARPVSEQKRVVMATLRLPELLKTVKDLESRLSRLESTKHNP